MQKLKSPLVITGQINNVTESTMGEGEKATKMYLVVFNDKTLPHQCRANTQFCTFIMADRMTRIFGADPYAAIDQDITVVARELGAYNAFCKVKGEIIPGRPTPEQLRALMSQGNELPQQPKKPKGDDDGGPVNPHAKTGQK
jgi:hypothetical protein